MAMVIAVVAVFGLTLALANRKSQSEFRPRGRFATSVQWGALPALPRPELVTRTRSQSRGPATARA